MVEDTRVCRRCEVEQPIENFGISDGHRRRVCNDCRPRGIPKPRPCATCGKVFQPKAYENSTHCSRQCAQARRREVSRLGKYTPINWGECRQCRGAIWWGGRGKGIGTGRAYCGEECRRAWARAEHHRRYDTATIHAPVTVSCVECGKPFTYSRYNKPQLVCSITCQNRRDRRLRPEYHAAKKARDRAIRRSRELNSLTADMVVPWKVFVRDRWICWLCGDKVDKSKRHPEGEAPTMDHVVPLSKGGEHSYANVRLAHSRCNTMRGNRDATGDQKSLQFALF